MKRAALAAVLVALAAGCGSGAHGTATRLTFSALNTNVGLAVFHLDCAPAGGDVTDPASACAALAHDPKLVTAPKPYTCLGGPTSWFDVTISGRLAGKPVHRQFSTCWAHGMATLDELHLFKNFNRHIRPRRTRTLVVGIPHTFPPGALRPGDLVTCRTGGHDLELGVPAHAGSMGSNGFGGVGVVGARLSGTRHADGSVSASCRRGES